MIRLTAKLARFLKSEHVGHRIVRDLQRQPY
jgi:hypothetical protein